MAQLFWGLAPIEKAAALFYYHPHSETAQLVYRLKYNNRPDIGEDMGRVMACEFQATDFFSDIDVLLPVPLASKRLRQRGYNQSEQLAIGISDITHLPIVSKALRRKHFQQSQTTLNRWQRQENVTDTFQLKEEHLLQGKHVLLIDDICTTGATLIACANVLKDIEDIRISVLTLGFTKD
jgi:ComF family protein